MSDSGAKVPVLGCTLESQESLTTSQRPPQTWALAESECLGLESQALSPLKILGCFSCAARVESRWQDGGLQLRGASEAGRKSGSGVLWKQREEGVSGT